MSLDTERYNVVARILHWGMALGFFFMWGCAFVMKYVAAEESWLEEVLFDLHISFGVTLLFLLALRIAVRLFSKPPSLPESMPKFEKTAAHLGHAALYLLPLSVMLIGWAEVDFGGWGVEWFGIEMPKIFPTIETWNDIDLPEFAETMHKWLAWAMFGLVIVHIAAVIKHRADGHDVLNRMAFGQIKK